MVFQYMFKTTLNYIGYVCQYMSETTSNYIDYVSQNMSEMTLNYIDRACRLYVQDCIKSEEKRKTPEPKMQCATTRLGQSTH